MMLNNVNDHTILPVDGQKTYIDHKIFECSTSVSWKSHEFPTIIMMRCCRLIVIEN